MSHGNSGVNIQTIDIYTNDGSSAKNIVQAPELENDFPLTSQRDNKPAILVVTYDTQGELTRKLRPPVEVRVSSGGVNDENSGKVWKLKNIDLL